MSRRFTSDELYAIRNHIPIDVLIQKLLDVPVKHTQNRLHFACPLCAGFQTSILQEKNLGRCFDCSRNFNTIEIMMYHMHICFVESVKRLKQYQSDFSPFNLELGLPIRPGDTCKTEDHCTRKENSKTTGNNGNSSLYISHHP